VSADLDLGGSGHYGRIEFAYAKMAVAAGIEMTECRLLERGAARTFL